MTDHVHGEDSYVSCGRYYVVSVNRYDDIFSNLSAEMTEKMEKKCYCGKDATTISRVVFTTVVERRDDWWDRTRDWTVKAHRCGDHDFEVDD
jgi:hypothetical protein